MKILIADDEGPARERLRSLVQEIGPQLAVVGEATNGTEVLRQQQRVQADLVLLDIRMPGMDGVEAATHLSQLENPPAVIFTTAFEEHALKAFEAHAVDYLLKPIRKERLVRALEKAQALTRVQRSLLRDIKQGQGTARTHLCVQLRGNMQLVSLDEVVYFRADHKYVTVLHVKGEVLIEDSLKALEKEFADRFLRIHRNALIAVCCLEGMQKDSQGRWRARLKGIGEGLEISRRHVASVRKLLKQGGPSLAA